MDVKKQRKRRSVSVAPGKRRVEPEIVVLVGAVVALSGLFLLPNLTAYSTGMFLLIVLGAAAFLAVRYQERFEDDPRLGALKKLVVLWLLRRLDVGVAKRAAGKLTVSYYHGPTLFCVAARVDERPKVTVVNVSGEKGGKAVDLTAKFVQAAGPFADFHGIPTTAETFGCDRLTVGTIQGDKVFEAGHPVDLTRNE